MGTPNKEKSWKMKKKQSLNRISRLCRFIKHLLTPPHPFHPRSAPSPTALARPTLEEEAQQTRILVSSFITLSLCLLIHQFSSPVNTETLTTLFLDSFSCS